MKLVKVESGKYRTEDERFEVIQDWTSADGGMKLVRCWKILERGWQVKGCHSLAQAKQWVAIKYA